MVLPCPCKRETHVAADMFLSYELFSLIRVLVVCVLSETCGKHYLSGVALDRRSHHH